MINTFEEILQRKDLREALKLDAIDTNDTLLIDNESIWIYERHADVLWTDGSTPKPMEGGDLRT